MPLISDPAHGTHFGLTGQRGPTACRAEGAAGRPAGRRQADAPLPPVPRRRGRPARRGSRPGIHARPVARRRSPTIRRSARPIATWWRASAATTSRPRRPPRSAELPRRSTRPHAVIAVATKGGGRINQHFGHAREFQVYEAAPEGMRFVGHRTVEDAYCQGGFGEDATLELRHRGAGRRRRRALRQDRRLPESASWRRPASRSATPTPSTTSKPRSPPAYQDRFAFDRHWRSRRDQSVTSSTQEKTWPTRSSSSQCTACGACEFECPNGAIKMKGDAYIIDAAKCTECEGKFDKPQVRRGLPGSEDLRAGEISAGGGTGAATPSTGSAGRSPARTARTTRSAQAGRCDLGRVCVRDRRSKRIDSFFSANPRSGGALSRPSLFRGADARRQARERVPAAAAAHRHGGRRARHGRLPAAGRPRRAAEADPDRKVRAWSPSGSRARTWSPCSATRITSSA